MLQFLLSLPSSPIMVTKYRDNYIKYCQKIIILDVVKRYLFKFLISIISWNLETLEEGQLCTWLALKVELFGNLVENDRAAQVEPACQPGC